MTEKTALNFPRHKRCVALSGGVGGAKLCWGLSRVLEADQLLLVANTGDDFEHFGLHVSPDLDTVMYTLAGQSNPDTGWGRRDESWNCMTALEELGGEIWFRLGDRDLATHLERTQRLRQGHSLSEVTAELARHLGIAHPVVPMTDDPVRTLVETSEGTLPFQDYFVRRRCEPVVTALRFEGSQRARLSQGMTIGLHDPRLGAVVICPSNPFVSVDPILSLPHCSEVLRACQAPLVAVSPIVGGEAIKGPAAKMMRELGMPVSALGVADYYQKRGLLDGFVLDVRDEELLEDVEALGVPALVTETVMRTDRDKIELAREVLDFAYSLG